MVENQGRGPGADPAALPFIRINFKNMVLPEKDGLLNGQHYEEIAERIYKDESPTSALIFFERQYSAVNVDFQKLLIKAIEGKIQAEYSTLNSLMLANPGTPLPEAKSWLPRLAGFIGIKERVIEYFTPKGEQWEVVNNLIQKHRHLFPYELGGKDEYIFQQCEKYSPWFDGLEESPTSPERLKDKVREELLKLEAETAREEAKFLRFYPPPGKDMQTEIIQDEEGNERTELKKVEPPNKELFQWVSFKNSVLEDFLYALLPEGREEMKREIEARKKRRQLAQRLMKGVLMEYPETEIFGDEESLHWVHFPILEEAFRDFTRLKKDAYSEEAFREKLRGKLAALKADTEEKYNRWNPEEAQPLHTIGLPKDFHKERQRERMGYLMALLQNTLLAEYLTALFSEEGQPEAGETLPFGEELEKVVRAALEKRGLLDANGHFLRTESPKGEDFRYTQVKALFVVLRQREYLPYKPRTASQAAQKLATLFASRFNFEFTPRTVTSAERERNIGQDKEERSFTSAIPKKE